MNRIYRVIWSRVRNAWVVASELATSRGKDGRRNKVTASCAGELALSSRSRAWPLRIAILAALFAHAPTQAADRYWDADYTGPGLGGSGTWDLDPSNLVWSEVNHAFTGPYHDWDDTALDDAIFGGTAGVVTLAVPITVNNLEFLVGGYTLQGSSLTFGGADPTIDGTVTINSTLISSAGLTKNGAGWLTLNSANPNLLGTITINAGGLSVIDDAALGPTSNGITLAAGTSLSSTGALSTARTVTLSGGLITLSSPGTGSARFTGAGGLDVTGNGIILSNDANDYTGQTRFRTNGSRSFTSIADLGVASSLGAPTDPALGTIYFSTQNNYTDRLYYIGDGDSSNRNWQIAPTSGGSFPATAIFVNAGTGTLRLTGLIEGVGGSNGINFTAQSADFELLGELRESAGHTGRVWNFNGGVGRTITLGGANTYSGTTAIGGVTLSAPVLANVGVNSSFGTGSGGGMITISGAGVLSYTGAAASTDRPWTFNNGTISNYGSGALTLTGAVNVQAGGATLGGGYVGDNTISGVISGSGSLVSNGAGTWVLTGANTRSGGITIENGTLRAGSASALGTTTGITINGGTLDLNDFNLSATTLGGAGGILDLGTANLTLSAAAGTTSSYAGGIVGTGGLTKLGASTLTLSGANSYTGATTIGGGTLALNFASESAPASNIISSSSTLNLGGGSLVVTGSASEDNTQTFAGVNITAGTNNISALSGSGHSLTLNLGAITRTGGLIDFDLPTSGFITTSNTVLGGWATVNNGSGYAKVVGGNITAFTEADYTEMDEAAEWHDNEFITDDDGDAQSFSGTVNGSRQLGGLRYTQPYNSTVTISTGQTLGVDGSILVATSVLNRNQTITGGRLTGPSGGGTLGIQQNGSGIFTIASEIVDNGGAIGFTKSGSGEVQLTNPNNTYSGPTLVTAGTLQVDHIADGAEASSIGTSSAAPENLVLEGSELRYVGAGDTSDRGLTIRRSGSILNSQIGVATVGANLEFSGLVTSPDGAGLIKAGAGTLTLSNATNDYTGVTTINAGTLAVSTLANGGQVSSIGASSNSSASLLLNNGGKLDFIAEDATVVTDRGFTVTSGGNVGVSDLDTTLTFTGNVVGHGGLTKSGAGTLVLSGTNAFTGPSTLAAGVLRAGSNQAFGASAWSVNAGARLDLADFDNTITALSGLGSVTLGSGTLTINNGGGWTFSGAISGTGGLTKLGGATQTLSGCNNTYEGVTTISAGTLSVDCLRDGGIASGIGMASADATNLVLGSGTLEYTGESVEINRGFQAAGGTLSVTRSDQTLEITGQVTGTNFSKGGDGTLVLTGDNAQTGYINVNAGTLRAGSAGALSTGGLRFDGAGATVDLNGFDASVAYLHEAVSGANTVLLGGATLNITGGGGTYSGVISGTGNLIKSGGSTQVLNGCDNSYTGATTLSGGGLTVSCLNDGGINSSIGRSSADASNLYINGVFSYNGAGSSTNRRFTLGPNTVTFQSAGTGAVNFTSTDPITFDGTTARVIQLRGTNTGDNTFSPQITNAGSGVVQINKYDAGTWVLANSNNTYTGRTLINGGVLSVSKLADGEQASSIGASTNIASNLVIGNDSRLRYTGATDSSTDRRFTLLAGNTFIESSGTGAVQFTNTDSVTLSGVGTRTIGLGGTNTGNNIMGGLIADSNVTTGKTTLAKNDAGTWILTGNNTYTGNTVINDGNLQIGNGGTTGNAGAGNVIVSSPTSTLSINRSDAFNFNGTLSGPGRLAQVGTGTTRLTSASNSIGATTVSAGTLEVDAGAALTTSTVALNGASTLNVEGTLQANGGTAAVFTGDAGASTIHVAAGGTLRASGDLGDGNDVLNVTGTFDSGAGTLSLGAGDDTFTLNDGATISGAIDAGGAATADTLQINNALARAFDGTGFSSFERLVKQNAGVLTLTGAQTFSAGTEVTSGTLDVDGTLDTGAVSLADGTTLNIDGALQGVGATQAAIAGSSGANTIVVNTGATLSANGDLGDGEDTLTLGGAIDTGAAALSLGAGDDTLILNDGAAISGSIDGGTAVNEDTLQANNAAALTLDGSNVGGFEDLFKTNTGVLTLTGSHVYSEDVAIMGGVLDVDGNLETQLITLGSTLNVDGTVQAAGGAPTSLSGTALVNTVLVNAGGVLRATGNLAGGNDVVTVGGTLDTAGGTLLLGGGDDTLTLNDGAVISGLGVDAGTATTADRLILDNAVALTFDGSRTAGFETLIKQNSGSATMTGTQAFAGGASLDGGVLDIDGALDTPALALADGTTLNVDGTVQAVGATQTAITGSAGVNTVVVDDAGTLLATGDFGDGADVLDVSGTLDTGGGVLSLGDGDDTFVVHDDSNISGTVDGGAGIDSRVYNINLTADVGALLGFEGLTKSGTGTLNINGPGTTSLAEVEVLGGTLNVAAAGDVTGVQTTTVESSSTLNVDGTYAGSTGDDTFTVAGTVSGAGSIDLGTGDDVLTLQDGAAVNLTIDAGGDTAGDTVVLDNASALTFDGTNVAGFETLVKQNTGIATLTGTHGYDSTVLDVGTLDVDGTLESTAMSLAGGTTLNIDGTVHGAGGTQTSITGSTGVDTILVNDGASLLASGDLGDGDDVLDVAGTLDTGGGVFSLGAGDDTFVVHDTTVVIGTLDAGAGNDQLNVNVSSDNLVPLGSTTGFESLGKSGLGTLEINGASDFIDVQVQAGLLDIAAGGSITAATASVSASARLNVDGALAFTTGGDAFTVAGTLTGGGSIDMLDGDDQLTILDGADLSGLATSLDGGAGNDTLTANIATTATLGGVIGFETLTKDGTGTLNIAGPASSSFASVQVQSGVLDVGATGAVSGVSTTNVSSGATLHVDGTYAGSAGDDTFTVAGTVEGAGSIDLGGGDDVLTIRDGAALDAVVDAGADVAGDRVVLDNAAAFELGGSAVSGFEHLEKQNTGTATLTDTHTYASTTLGGGTLDVDGTLETDTASLADATTLHVDGTLRGASGAQAAIAGSSGVNTVTVAAGATLAATGDLGDDGDVLDVGGTLDAGAGSFNLGAGDDTFVIRDGTNVIGTVVGGAGLDTRVYDLAGIANVGALQEFEGLTKRNAGTLNINGPATTDLLAVAVEGGTLNIGAGGAVTGVQTTSVDAGAILNVDGAYAGSTGNDTFTVAGTVSGSGSVDLGDGDDTLTLQDGAVLNAAVDGGSATGADSIVLDNAADFTFDGANVAGFEALVKQNTGTAALTGAHAYDSTRIDGGTLEVHDTLVTTAAALADDTTLSIDGTVQGAGGTQTALSGTSGANSVLVNAGGVLLASGDLGDGNDVLDVAGTFDVGGGTFHLGAGDDTFIVHDGTTVTGTIDGGDGIDTRVYDINTTATLGALTNFEGLTKTGTGVLSIQGPGSSDLAEVEVLGGTLDIESTGGIVGITSATVGAGAILNVDGAFDFTAGGDTFTVAGTLTGTTPISMLDGDDQLTLSDGADLSGLVSPLDGGSGTDTLIADIATTATLGGVNSFENLAKQGAGILAIAADAAFNDVALDEGVLDVAAGTTTEASTATVSAGATLSVAGDFLFTAAGDSFTVAGTVVGAGAINMLDGDDRLTIRDGADLSGLATSLDGGDGDDTLTADIATDAMLGGATNFETLIKEGVGRATIAGPADSMFTAVLVREGELNVAAGAFVDPQITSVDTGATMTIDGTYHGTVDADTFTLAGTLAGGGAVDLLDGDDVLTIQSGADVTFDGVFDASTQAGADRFVLAGSGNDTLDASLVGSVFRNFEQFRKEGTGTWRLSGTGSNDWSVAEGTLIGDSESFGGNLDNAATIVFDQAAEGTYGHVLSGSGTLVKQNTGTLIMTGSSTFTGATHIEAGTLQVDGALRGAMTIASGATLSGIGTVGSVTHLAGGFIAPGAAGLPFATLTVAGDYSGGGIVRINTVLGNETSDTGRLVIQGSVSGTSTVLVDRWSGDGARTQGDGIEIIQVDGASASDSFRLGQPVQAGAYEYRLYQGGSVDANDWYLRSDLVHPNPLPDAGAPPAPAFRAGVPGYVLGHQANLEYGFTALGNMRARAGDQGRVLGATRSEQPGDAWMRVHADELDVAGTRFAAQDLQMTAVHFGTDVYAHDSGGASTHVGLMASVGESRATLFDTARAIAGLPTFAGEMESDAKGVGMYLTHFGGRGGYFDLSAQALYYLNRYRDQTLTDADQSGWGGTIAAEIGAVYALGADWMIEPQLQLAYQRLELDAFDDQVSRVDAVDDDGLRARAGVQLLRAPNDWFGMRDASPYVGLGAQHDFRDPRAVTIGGTTLNDEIPATTADVSVGLTGSVLSGVELHLDMRYQKSTEGEKDGVRANFGFRMTF